MCFIEGIFLHFGDKGEADSPPVVSGVLVERRVYRVFLGHAGRDARFLRQRFFSIWRADQQGEK